MKNNKKLILNYYEALKNMYVDKVEDKVKFVHISSNIIDDGIWNFVCNIKASTIEELEDIFNSSKQFFSNRKPRFYMLRSETNEDILQQVKENYTIYCEDSWFYTKLEKLNLNHKSKLPISITVSNNKEEVINTIMTGFSTGDPNDPYGDLSPTYRQALELKFEHSIRVGHTLHFVAKFKNKPISIATCTIKGDMAYLNNVTTLK